MTFDIAGDLVFGKPFGCLESTAAHPWVSLIFNGVKLSVWLQLPTYYPMLAPIMRWSIPQYLIDARKGHKTETYRRFQERLKQKPDHIDFMVKLIEPGNGVSELEQVSNGELMIGAGSETTATALSGAVYLLTQNPACLERLRKEIRTKFTDESEITFSAVNSLEYTGGVVYETLRMYPPVPGRLPRRTGDEGAEIIGKYVPPHVSTCVQLGESTIPLTVCLLSDMIQTDCCVHGDMGHQLLVRALPFAKRVSPRTMDERR